MPSGKRHFFKAKREDYTFPLKLLYCLFSKKSNHEQKYLFLPDSRLQEKADKRLLIIDSTTISLFKEILKGAGRTPIDGKKKGGIKVHTAMLASEDVPYLIEFSAAAKSDSPFMKRINPPRGAIVVMDKGYHHFEMMNKWKAGGADWVTRPKSSNIIEVTKEKKISKKGAEFGILADDYIILGRKKTKAELVPCRRIRFYDEVSKKNLEFITSNRRLSAVKITQIYKQRWQIETLFKRLKQNMLLKNFVGDNENAIQVQIWCALIADLLLKVVEARVKRKWAFSTLSAIVRHHLMNYTDLTAFLEKPDKTVIINPALVIDNQLKLTFSG